MTQIGRNAPRHGMGSPFRLLARLRSLRLPAHVEIAQRSLVKTGYWLLAAAWLWGMGSHTNVGDVFRGEPEYVQKSRIAMCRARPTPTERSDCVTRYLVGASNEKFYRVMVTIVPPLLLIPLCGATLRRMGKAAERKIRIL